MYELLAAAVAIEIFRDHLRNKSTDLLIDNTSAEFSLRRMHSKASGMNAITAAFWLSAIGENMQIWADRVPSELNIADLPTRAKRFEAFVLMFPKARRHDVPPELIRRLTNPDSLFSVIADGSLANPSN